MASSARPSGFRPAVPDDLVIDAARAEQSFPDAFRAVVAEHGDRLAVVEPPRLTSYLELDARSDAVARAVSETGTDTPIVVMAGHGASAITAMVGIAKAGGVYAVIEGAAPEPYRRDALTRLGARVVVTDAAHRNAVAPSDAAVHTIVLDELSEGRFESHVIAPDAAMSISFTSGSSGTPKAVVHSHRNVVHNARRVGAAFGLLPEDRFLAAASVQFTASATVVYSSLLAGAAIWPSDFSTRGTARFEGDAQDAGLTVVQLTPSLSGGLATHASRDGVPSVRAVSVGGDRLDLRQVHELHTAFPAATIVYRYNTSETNWVAGAVIDPEHCEASGRAPVGWPVPWVDVSVRADDGREVAPGEVGELWVAGEFLALGYWGDDERTAAAFSTTATGRVYRTRDRARRRADGMLDLVGRDDAAVKIRGVLVDPALVEREIERLPGVRAAAVVSHVDDDTARLAAFVVSEGETAIDIRRAVAGTLPRGMVPQTVITLDGLPTTERGKVDTEALREMLPSTSGAAAAPARPEDELARGVARRMAEVLGVDRVGPDDDFFALGGDSLSTIELAVALGLDHGTAPELSTLLEYPTPASLAAWIRDATPQRRDLACFTTGSEHRLPVVFFPGSGGTGLHIVRPVAKSIRDRTSYVVVPRALEYRGVPDRTITTKASHAVRAILTLDPEARVIVVGRSSGGITAVEAARQLAELGHEPPLVVLLDSLGPRRPRGMRFRENAALARRTYRSPTRRALEYLRLAVVTEPHELYLAWSAGIIRRTGPKQVRAFRALLRSALAHHRPRPYSGRTVLLRATDRSEDIVDVDARDLGWAPYLTGPFTIVDVPGTHIGMAQGAHLVAAVAALEVVMAEVDREFTRA
jgi:amino acid adenylation domain-containing protein